MTNESVKLEPCPFCGSRAIVEQAGDRGRWQVSCGHDEECLASITWGSFARKVEAIEAWNTRHQSKQREAVLEEALERIRKKAVTWGANPVDGYSEIQGIACNALSAALTTPAPAVSTEDEQVETIATFLLGSVNAPEQEIYRVSRAILSRLRGDSE